MIAAAQFVVPARPPTVESSDRRRNEPLERTINRRYVLDTAEQTGGERLLGPEVMDHDRRRAVANKARR